MCRQRELMERLKILEESGMISSRVSAFCMDAAEIILGEKEDADGEKLSMLITHLALAGDRMEKEDDREMEISPEVLEGVRQEAVYPRALCVSQQILKGTALKFTQTEADFLTVHLCNILM